MNQNYGVLRVVRVKSGRSATGGQTQGRYATGWLPEDGLVHVLSRQETTIGRALNNDVILMDPTVSREHARMLLDSHGWHVINLTARNVVRVNGHAVPSGGAMPMQPQDLLVLGSTMLQLIAPNPPNPLNPASCLICATVPAHSMGTPSPRVSRKTYRPKGVRQLLFAISPSLSRNSRSQRSEEHTSELQSHLNIVCRLLLEKKKQKKTRSQRPVHQAARNADSGAPQS